MTVFAVIYSNYNPDEVDSLWTTEVEAQKRANELNESDREKGHSGNWHVIPRAVNEVWIVHTP